MSQTGEIDTPASVAPQPARSPSVTAAWWAALVTGMVGTLVVLFDGRFPLSMTLDEKTFAGATSVALTALTALVIGAVTVAFWVVEALSIRRLRHGLPDARVALTVLGAVSLVIDAYVLLFVGDASVLEKVLVGVHVLLVVAALVWSWLPATSSALGAPDAAAATPASRAGRPVRLLVVLALLLVAAWMSFTGSARNATEKAVATVASNLGVQGATASCGAATSIDALAGLAQQSPCTLTAPVGNLPALVTNTQDDMLDVEVRDAISLTKMAQSINEAATKQGVAVIDTDCGQSRNALAFAPPGTVITCNSAIEGGHVATVVATVDDDQGHVTFHTT